MREAGIQIEEKKTQRQLTHPEVKELLDKNRKLQIQRDPDLNSQQIERIARERTADQVKAARAKRRAETDKLTGLKNERGFEQRFREMVNQSKRNGVPLTVIYADLNGLKEINDTQGHKAGNETIRKLAALMSEEHPQEENQKRKEKAEEIFASEKRETDLFSRSSSAGDEFVAVLYNCDRAGARKYWERLSGKLKNAGVNVSVGAALIDPSSTETVKEAMELAETAMYVSKITYRQNNSIGSNFTADEDLTRDQIQYREKVIELAKQRGASSRAA